MLSFIIVGNQCDQRFSILSAAFSATNIITLDELKKLVLDSPMVPKAICRSLLFTYGWKSFVEDSLSDIPLENHSKYNSFLITSENGLAKLRLKKLPQDTQLVPRAGIKLLKDGHSFGPVGVSDFRIERLNFDKISRGLNIYMDGLPLEKKMEIQSSWDKLRKTLEDLPKIANTFPKMNLETFPKVIEETLVVPDQLRFSHDVPEVRGELFPESAVEGHLEDEVSVGMDVCIYTEDKRSRPWMGRIVKILDNKKFILHWYGRKSSRSSIFTALSKSDGSPYLAELDNDTVMFWMISEPQSRKQTSFSVSNYWMETIRLEYLEMDER